MILLIWNRSIRTKFAFFNTVDLITSQSIWHMPFPSIFFSFVLPACWVIIILTFYRVFYSTIFFNQFYSTAVSYSEIYISVVCLLNFLYQPRWIKHHWHYTLVHFLTRKSHNYHFHYLNPYFKSTPDPIWNPLHKRIISFFPLIPLCFSVRVICLYWILLYIFLIFLLFFFNK